MTSTFHVKRSASASVPDPHQIGKSVRDVVNAFLRGISYVSDPELPGRIEKFAASIVLWGSKMNLTAHPEDPDEIAFHVIDSLMPIVLATDRTSILWGQFAKNRKILDLGSGAGFPGLVLAAATPAHFTLVESRRKRASFLQFAVAEMGLNNVTIEAKPAEQLDLNARYDLATARAFGDVSEFFALAANALKLGGLTMLYANPSQHFSSDVQRIPYRVARRDQLVDRILAVRKYA